MTQENNIEKCPFCGAEIKNINFDESKLYCMSVLRGHFSTIKKKLSTNGIKDMRKPFNLETAKRGAPFECDDGVKAVQFHILDKAPRDHQLVVVFSNKMVVHFDLNGKIKGLQILFMSDTMEEDQEVKSYSCSFCGADNIGITVELDRKFTATCMTCWAKGPPRESTKECMAAWRNRNDK
jgi:hypothetical protein